MRIGVIGSGHIGGNCARQAVKNGHEVVLSFARDRSKLDELASELGTNASVGDPAQSVAFNAERMPGARYVKSFNTLTSRFQEQAAARNGSDRVVQWICGDDQAAKDLVAGLIEDMGYVPVDLGGTDNCAVMEAPRRPGAVYGEEYRAADAQAVVDAVRDGVAIPPTPSYE